METGFQISLPDDGMIAAGNEGRENLSIVASNLNLWRISLLGNSFGAASYTWEEVSVKSV
jgi:hypothetical protein